MYTLNLHDKGDYKRILNDLTVIRSLRLAHNTDEEATKYKKFTESYKPEVYAGFLYEGDMNICDLVIKYTDYVDLLNKYLDTCLKVRALNDPSAKTGRTYFMLAAQFGSNDILKSIYEKYNAKLKYDLFDNLGRGVLTVSKDEYTRYLVLSMILKKPQGMQVTPKQYYKLKQANDRIKDVWNLHLRSDDLKDYQEFLDNTNIWDLVAIDGWTILHSAAANKLGRRSNEKLDATIAKFEKNVVPLDIVEITSGKNATVVALDSGYVYAVCRLTVDLKDQNKVLPDIEGRSIDFYIEDFSDYQGKNCRNVVETFSKDYIEQKKKVEAKKQQ